MTGDEAMQDVLDVVNEAGDGKYLTIQWNVPSTITRSRYNEMPQQAAPTWDVPAFPVMYSPSQKELDKVGIREQVDVLAYTPAKAWNDAGYSIDDLIIGNTLIQLDGKTFELRDRQPLSQYGTYYLYIVIGMKRK